MGGRHANGQADSLTGRQKEGDRQSDRDNNHQKRESLCMKRMRTGGSVSGGGRGGVCMSLGGGGGLVPVW